MCEKRAATPEARGSPPQAGTGGGQCGTRDDEPEPARLWPRSTATRASRSAGRMPASIPVVLIRAHARKPSEHPPTLPTPTPARCCLPASLTEPHPSGGEADDLPAPTTIHRRCTSRSGLHAKRVQLPADLLRPGSRRARAPTSLSARDPVHRVVSFVVDASRRVANSTRSAVHRPHGFKVP